MKLGELVFELVVKGSDKKLGDAYDKMKKTQKLSEKQLKLEKFLGRALTDKEKATLGNALALNKVATSALTVVGAVTSAIIALDRMANSLAKSNQAMISFQRQTGLSFATLNKYAGASAAVNYNASEEQTAQTLQRLQNNLREIKLGRGDISPFQELAMIGGKPINVWGKSVEQVIEEVREAIKGVDDVSATNIITRMGFSPDDLLMLRMTKEEFDKISSSYFLSPQQREEMYKYSLELKQIHLQLEYLYKTVLIEIMRVFHNIVEETKPFISAIGNIGKALNKLDKSTLKYGFHLKAILDPFSLLLEVFNKIKQTEMGQEIAKWGDALKLALNPFMLLFYILEDIAVYFLGGKSLLGVAIDGLKEFAKNFKETLKDIFGWISNFTPLIGNLSSLIHEINKYNTEQNDGFAAGAVPRTQGNTTTNNANVANNVTVYSSLPPSEIIDDTTKMSFAQVQLGSMAV